jgi:hypothetical protein
MKNNNIIHFQNLLSIFIAFLLISSCLVGCSSLSHYKISPDFEKSKYKRIGLLVCRIGNKHEGVLAPITIETDYSNRICKRELSAGMLYMKDHKDIYIDDNERLLEGFPNYPVFRCNVAPDSSKQCIKFYKNITPHIYKTLEEVLNDKGYKVIDIKEITKTWNPPFSEMNIQKIINNIGNNIDALLVFHYFDVENNGMFSDLWYTLSMFDVLSKKSVIDFQSFYFGGIVSALYSDQEMPYGKIEVHDTKQSTEKSMSVGGGWELVTTTTKTKLLIHLSEEEIIEYVMKYLRYGFKSHSDSDKGLEVIIP